MHIRLATIRDRNDIRNVYLCAFSDGERDIVSELAVNLLSEKTTPQTISLVAETGSSVIGHVAFSPVIVENNLKMQGYILAPVGVKPDYQKRGIGSQLIENGMQQLLNMGVTILFVYGDPAYYRRFDFSAATADRFTPPYKLQYPLGWQAIQIDEYDSTKSPIRITCVNSLCDPELW